MAAASFTVALSNLRGDGSIIGINIKRPLSFVSAMRASVPGVYSGVFL